MSPLQEVARETRHTEAVLTALAESCWPGNKFTSEFLIFLPVGPNAERMRDVRVVPLVYDEHDTDDTFVPNSLKGESFIVSWNTSTATVISGVLEFHPVTGEVPENEVINSLTQPVESDSVKSIRTLGKIRSEALGSLDPYPCWVILVQCKNDTVAKVLLSRLLGKGCRAENPNPPGG